MKIIQQPTSKVLILSPSASHPQDYGNRHRVYQTASVLKQQGYEIHFILYPTEPDWAHRIPPSAGIMRSTWDSFTVLAPSGRNQPQSAGEYHLIDEWWDPAIGNYLAWLFARGTFDVFVVNYAFFSKAFEYAPKRTVKVLETHDRFSGRKELLTALDAPLEAFYTTEAEESTALERSDIVVAIKDTEASFYRGLTKRQVVSVPFWLDRDAPPPKSERSSLDRPLRVGFIGALNVVNAANINDFLRCWAKCDKNQTERITIDIAGDVCFQVETALPNVNLLGRLASLDAFYARVDVILIPMMLSTGLKIKVAEALAYGRAVVSTRNGFDGFQPADEFHCLDSFEDVCRALILLSADWSRLELLERHSIMAAHSARDRRETGYRNLSRAIVQCQRSFIFLTDQPLHVPDAALIERIAQWCRFCSQFGRTTVVYLGNEPINQPGVELAMIDIVSLAPGSDRIDGTLAAINELVRPGATCELIISVRGDLGPLLWDVLKERYDYITLDTWIPELARIARQSSGMVPLDMWLAPDRAKAIGARHLSVTAYHKEPRALTTWKAHRGARGIAVVSCGPDEQDRAGIDVFLSKASDACPISAVSLAPRAGHDFDKDFFQSLRALHKPYVLLAVGTDARAISICYGIAATFRLACIDVSRVTLPRIVALGDGTSRLCCTYVELAEHICDVASLMRNTSPYHDDAGWITYERLIFGRSAKATSMETSPVGTLEVMEVAR